MNEFFFRLNAGRLCNYALALAASSTLLPHASSPMHTGGQADGIHHASDISDGGAAGSDVGSAVQPMFYRTVSFEGKDIQKGLWLCFETCGLSFVCEMTLRARATSADPAMASVHDGHDLRLNCPRHPNPLSRCTFYAVWIMMLCWQCFVIFDACACCSRRHCAVGCAAHIQVAPHTSSPSPSPPHFTTLN